MTSNESEGGLSRRKVLVAGAGTALGAAALAACGGGGSTGSSTSAGSGGASGGGSQVLAKVADVPVGGAVSATDSNGKPVIVSQPTAGDVVAFSAICTHMGCTVAPHGSELLCPCHGSTYDLATGDNTGGPAPSPLPKVSVKVTKGEVVET
ncbi:Rieske (2Fe-2S) protein [Nocardioides ungokensis]|uniref:Rieske (2Fe-2S) protein n=1 Tax=Nocardioides ungokensis TaxID=1643322 RepID=UPI0015E042F9|nr:Rieske (2Fe-2S) protein [Nocardioides ungokensis]